MTESAEAFIQRLAAALPPLRASAERTYQECAAEGLADAAPQFVLDDYTRELLARLQQGDAEAAAAMAEFAQLASVLETEFGRDPENDQLIDTSFVVLLPGREGPGPDVLGVLGPQLAAAAARHRGWRAPVASRALVERMLAAFPALTPLARDHEYGEHRDVLTHPFIGDVADRVIQNYLSGRPGGLAEARAIVEFLEGEFDPDEIVDNPIAVSFVENLPYPHEPGADVVRLLGPKLRTELNRQRF